jgi:methylase of polypeptide subunit release factors
MRRVLALARWRLARSRVHQVAGGPLVVLEQVFDPVHTRVGAWLAEEALRLARPGETWLEVGCGSGVVACALARAGARVVATDIDAQAVRNTRLNAALNELAVETLVGDMFTPVAGRRFDAVVANLPFWPGSGAGLPLPRAFAGGEDFALLRRFAAEVPRVAPRAYTVLSEAFAAFEEARAALGPTARLLRRERVRGEWLDLFLLEGNAPEWP